MLVAVIAEASEVFQFDTIDDVLRDIAAGRMVIVTDDADRENEGDLIMAAEKATPAGDQFHGHARPRADLRADHERARRATRACSAWSRKTAKCIGPISPSRSMRRKGVTTGISAHDRAATIRPSPIRNPAPDDLVQPGHVFPLRAKDGGVLRRAGHTEAAVDLARLAGLQPAGVLCEILHDDGTMARLPELMEFRKKHGLRICTIQSLIALPPRCARNWSSASRW